MESVRYESIPIALKFDKRIDSISVEPPDKYQNNMIISTSRVRDFSQYHYDDTSYLATIVTTCQHRAASAINSSGQNDAYMRQKTKSSLP